MSLEKKTSKGFFLFFSFNCVELRSIFYYLQNMIEINNFLDRYHVKPIEVIEPWDVSLHRQWKISFSYWGSAKELLVSPQLIELLSDQIKPLSSIELLKALYPWSWMNENGTFNRLYYSPFRPNDVVRWDLVALISWSVNDMEVGMYLGKWYYLLKTRDNDPFVVNLKMLNDINPTKSIIRYNGIDYPIDFKEMYIRLLDSNYLQLNGKSHSVWYTYNATQKPNSIFVEELYRMFMDFWEVAESIMISLNQRIKVKYLWNHLWLHQNRNFNSFYRDWNYSFSVVDESTTDWHEIAIISFTVTLNKEIEIVQIGGNVHYKLDFLLLRDEIISYMKEYLHFLWFNRMKVLRWDKNINYIHPKQRTLNNGFNLKEHQNTMWIRYNLTPSRRRWFTKIKPLEKSWEDKSKQIGESESWLPSSERYSSYFNLQE